ncbi:MAG TPA: STAS domain-containing protein [Vicinamibacterales bacterium]
MELKVTRQGPVAVLHPEAQVDGRAAFQFEQDVLELLQDGTRYVAVDFSKVTLLASAGIRVLILMLHKLEARDGMLVLCGLTPYVRNVLDVSGLTGQFTIVPGVADALRCFPSADDDGTSGMAGLARRVLRLLSIGDGRQRPPAAPLADAVAHDLAARVVNALTRR